jgi:hypothetical protein
LRYLTFFGINIKISSQFSAVSSQKNLLSAALTSAI